MKQLVQGLIRNLHVSLSARPLPDRLGICLHALERAEWHALGEAISWLRERGHAFCGPDELVSGSARGVHLSFDDNYRSWHQALPLLERLGVSATFYVNTLPLRDRATAPETDSYFDLVDHGGERVALASWEVRELREAGHVIGCHSHSHADLGSIPHEEAVEEIRVNKEILEDILGEQVAHFSFPFGMRRHFTERLRTWCKENGFRTVSSAIPGMQHATSLEPHDLHRTRWHLNRSLTTNVDDLRVDGRLFERLTGRGAIG